MISLFINGAYSPEEQFQRLLAARFKVSQPVIPAQLPATLREGYERLVEQTLPDHPFRGSVDGLHPVFGEYLYAWLLADANATTSSLSGRAREVLRTGSYLPTRALGRFVLALTARNGPARVGARDLGFLYESLLSDQEKLGDISLRLRSIGEEGEPHAWVSVFGRPLDFKVTAERSVWFWRQLMCASVSIAGDIELGFPGGEFRLGPAVDVECPTIRCPAELRVYPGDDKQGTEVTLTADAFEAMARAPVVRGKRFYVRGTSVPWPWSDYQTTEATPLATSPEVADAYNHLARILLWFRAAGYDEIARVDDLVEKAATGGTPIAKELLDFCVKRGLIRRAKLYTLDDAVLASYGINYVDLKRRILREPVIRLLVDFLSQRNTG